MTLARFLLRLLLATTAPGVRAATLADCSEPALATAVAAGGEVTFACDGTIALNSPLVITQQVTLDGAGRAVTLSGRGFNRLFLVRTNGSLTLRRLALINGWTTNYYGGAISNAGVLALEQCLLSNHTAQVLSLSAWSAYGGAIYSARGAVVLTQCRLVNNTARGTDDVQGFSISGGSGRGGAILLENGELRLTNCVLANNLAKAGHGGTNTFGGYPGGQAGGGAVYARTGSVVITGCLFTGNRVESGAGGRNRDGEFAIGGAVAVVDDLPATIEASTFIGNSVLGGDGWKTSQPYGRGGDASGGAVYRVPFRTVISNCTFVANRATGGSTAPNAFQTFGQGRGGAVSGFGLIAFSTIVSNSVASGVGCIYLPTGSGTQVGQARGCIYAWNSNASNIEQTIDLGYNLSTDSRQFTNTTSITNTDPRLGPLADNGGPGPTMALLPGSQALDAIPSGTAGLAPADARGVARPAGGGGDIGAFELGPALAPSLSARTTGGEIWITFAGEAGRQYRVLYSENLQAWQTNRSTTLATNGVLSLRLPLGADERRFFRLETTP
jgi:hypothetical protein